MTTQVLLVDDHPTMRHAMRLVLEEGGHEVREAADGHAALDLVRVWRPDVLVLDMHIPGTSGSQVLAAIRDDRETSAIRVVVVTAEGEEGRVRVLRMGADAYLTKPFSPDELLRTVERVLASGGSLGA